MHAAAVEQMEARLEGFEGAVQKLMGEHQLHAIEPEWVRHQQRPSSATSRLGSRALWVLVSAVTLWSANDEHRGDPKRSENVVAVVVVVVAASSQARCRSTVYAAKPLDGPSGTAADHFPAGLTGFLSQSPIHTLIPLRYPLSCS